MTDKKRLQHRKQELSVSAIKKYLPLFLTAFTAFSPLAFADDKDAQIDFTDYSAENIKTLPKKQSPFTFKTKIDIVQKAKIDNGFFKGDEIQFGEIDAELGSMLYYSEAYKSGAAAALNYSVTYLHWASNPWICQSKFYIATLNISGFSKKLNRWLWKGQVAINVDTQEWDFQDYAYYDMLLWGRYEYRKDLGLHVGIIVETGMLMDRVYPILGADWQISKKWKLNLVYPLNVSLDYLINHSWSVALAARSFNTRLRAGHHEGQSKALIRYQNVGAELAVKFENDKMSANFHAGSTLGGTLRIADSHNHHPRRYRLNPSGYVGAELDLKF